MTKLRPTVTCAIAVSLALAFHNAFCSGLLFFRLGSGSKSNQEQ